MTDEERVARALLGVMIGLSEGVLAGYLTPERVYNIVLCAVRLASEPLGLTGTEAQLLRLQEEGLTFMGGEWPTHVD